MTHTHTYAIAVVSPATYAEIRSVLVEAGYQHAIHDNGDGEVLDMHGIALRAAPDRHPHTGQPLPPIRRSVDRRASDPANAGSEAPLVADVERLQRVLAEVFDIAGTGWSTDDALIKIRELVRTAMHGGANG